MSTIKSSSEHLTLNADGASKDIKFQANGVEKASISSAGAFTSTTIDATALTGALPAISGASLTNLPAGGKVLQIVNYQTGAVATGTTVIPFDDTIPQITEGDEYMTLAITPTSATSKLRIDVVVFLAHSAVAGDAVATTLFQDTTANALATSWHANSGGERVGSNVFSHTMTSGATSVTTFKVRAGGQTGGTTTLNGRITARSYGGSVASSITITEYEV